MWTVQQKADFILWYAELKSVVRVQRKWRNLHPGGIVPDEKSLNHWLKYFKQTGGDAKQKSLGRPGTSEDNAERIRQSCVRSPKKSIARLNLELGIPKSTIQNVIHEIYAFMLKDSAEA
jgi:hypothetical protein